MDDAGEPAEKGQEDVDEEVGAAAALEEHGQRRQDHGYDDLADVAAAASVSQSGTSGEDRGEGDTCLAV